MHIVKRWDGKIIQSLWEQEEFEEKREVIRSRKSKKDRQNNGQKKKDKRTNNNLKNITHKTKDRVTWTPQKTWSELRCSRKVSCSWSHSGTRCVNLVTNPVISHEWGKGRKVFTTSGTYPWSFVTQTIRNE